MMWSEKYRPQKIEQMVGNEQARLDAFKWLNSWIIGTKPLLMVGPPGTGKTTLARVLARSLQYDLLELNASDTRNKQSLQERIRPVFSNPNNLLGSKLMLFLDEVDGISGREDTGGVDVLTNLLKQPTVPVMMAANEKSDKIRGIAKISKIIELKRVPPRLLLLYLDHVLQSENISISATDKMDAVIKSHGDIRAMLNNAQSRAAGYASDSKSAQEVDIQDAVNEYFSTDLRQIAVDSLLRADASYPDPRYQMLTPELRRKDLIAAIFSSVVSSKLDLQSLAKIMDVLSRADLIVGRSGKMREWKLLKYVTSMLANTIFDFSRGKSIRYNQYSMPWQTMGPLFAKGQSVRRILGVLAPICNSSKSTCGSITLPYLLHILAQEGDIDLEEFCLNSFGDETYAESLSKLLEKSKK